MHSVEQGEHVGHCSKMTSIHEQSEASVFLISDHPNQNVWQHHCSESSCKAHLKLLPEVALTSTSNYIHEEEGK